MKWSIVSIFLFLFGWTALFAQLDIPEDVQVSKDIVYNIVDKDTLSLDVYWYEGAEVPRPLVIWIHGGGWRKGSKDNPREAVRLLEHGYVVASINYRLSDKARFPAQILDCKSAIRWLKANALTFNADSSSVGVWGSSAGGHLSALVGTSWHVKEWERSGVFQGVSSKVQAVCDYYGPTDFLRMDYRPGKIIHDSPDSPEGLLIGGPVQENKQKAKMANPMNYIRKGTPPFLILHGKEDALVLWEQSQMLHDALRSKGQESELILLEGLGHGGRGWEELFGHLLRFFNKYLKGLE